VQFGEASNQRQPDADAGGVAGMLRSLLDTEPRLQEMQGGGLVRVEDGLGAWPAAHQTTSRQTGQARRRLRRSQRAWVRALASWKPQVGQEATQRP
jgi:hypothetical protein